MSAKERGKPWERIARDYITGKDDVSYAKLAKKYGCNMKDVSRHGKKEEWVKRRKQYRKQVEAQLIARSRYDAVHMRDKAIKVVDALMTKMEQIASDPDQFNLYHETVGEEGGQYHTEEVKRKKADTRAISDLAKSAKTIYDLYTSAAGVLSEKDKKQIELAEQKLDIERKKAAMFGDDEDEETGVVLLAPVKVRAAHPEDAASDAAADAAGGAHAEEKADGSHSSSGQVEETPDDTLAVKPEDAEA